MDNGICIKYINNKLKFNCGTQNDQWTCNSDRPRFYRIQRDKNWVKIISSL